MTVYSYKNIFINLLIIIFVLMSNVFAQEDVPNIYAPPQNLVPDVFEIKEEINDPLNLNNSKYFAGLAMIILNLGSYHDRQSKQSGPRP